MTLSWPIRRTKPIGLTLGSAIPVFIHNWQYHLSTVDVYADGSIDAWGFVDRPLFRTKIETGWVVTAAPVGATISIHNLGSCTVAQADWQKTPADLITQVENEIRRLNPAGRELLDLHGSDVELRGKVRYAKLGLSDKKPVLETHSFVVGEHVPIFRRSAEEFVLEPWFVFADGTSRVGAEGPTEDLGQTLVRLASGALSTAVPDGASVRIPALGVFEVAASNWFVDSSERTREIADLLSQAQGKPPSIATCVEAFREFEATRTDQARERLRSAYEAVPEHLRMYCGDMDSKDWPIVRALYGDR